MSKARPVALTNLNVQRDSAFPKLGCVTEKMTVEISLMNNIALRPQYLAVKQNMLVHLEDVYPLDGSVIVNKIVTMDQMKVKIFVLVEPAALKNGPASPRLESVSHFRGFVMITKIVKTNRMRKAAVS